MWPAYASVSCVTPWLAALHDVVVDLIQEVPVAVRHLMILVWGLGVFLGGVESARAHEVSDMPAPEDVSALEDVTSASVSQEDVQMSSDTIMFKLRPSNLLNLEWYVKKIPMVPFRYGGDIQPVRYGSQVWLMTPKDFYESVGRPELWRKFRLRRLAKHVLVPTGALIGGAGPLTVLVVFVFTLWGPGSGSGMDALGALGLGAGMAALGGSMFFWGLRIDPHPVSLEERKQLALGHNAQLARRTHPTGLQFSVRF
jgi:hypothetical protein